MATCAGNTRKIGCSNSGIRILMRLDGVNSVTIRTNRSLAAAPRHGPTVNALHEFLLYRFMTLGAGGRHIETEYWRLVVGGCKNLVRTVAVGTDRGLFRTCRDRPAVHALQV